jgi:hypothetical protein
VDDLNSHESDELRSQKREAFARISAVWQDALGAGIEPDILAHVALLPRSAILSRPMAKAPLPILPKGCPTAFPRANSPSPSS